MKIVRVQRQVYVLPDGTEMTKAQLQAYMRGIRHARNTMLVEMDKLHNMAAALLTKGPVLK